MFRFELDGDAQLALRQARVTEYRHTGIVPDAARHWNAEDRRIPAIDVRVE